VGLTEVYQAVQILDLSLRPISQEVAALNRQVINWCTLEMEITQ